MPLARVVGPACHRSTVGGGSARPTGETTHLIFADYGPMPGLERRIADDDHDGVALLHTWGEGGMFAHHHVEYRGAAKSWTRDPVPIPGSVADADCAYWKDGGRHCHRLVTHHVDLFGGIESDLVYFERQFYCRDHVGAVSLRHASPALGPRKPGESVETTLELEASALQSAARLAYSRQQPLGTVVSDLIRTAMVTRFATLPDLDSGGRTRGSEW